MGEMVEFASNSGRTRGYLARPASGQGPGVVVIQEWWGLVPHIHEVTDRFADQGFVALAPDFYQGTTTTEPDEAGKLMMALNIEQTAKDLRGAIDFLLSHGATGSKVGVVGFCMGGQLALYAGMVSPTKVGAIVDFYGVHPSVKLEAEKIQAPVLGNFAELDTFTPPAAVQELEQQLNQAGVKTDFKIYPGTDHAFFNDHRPEVYNREAAEDAWQRTIQFLQNNLPSS